MSQLRTMAVVVLVSWVASSCVYFARVSTDSSGAQVSERMVVLDVSADGRYVLVGTDAALVAGDTNGVTDIYRKDTLTGTMLLISQRFGNAGNDESDRGSMSDDGRWIAYRSSASNLVVPDSNGVRDTLLYDADGNITTRASVDTAGDQLTSASSPVGISGDGRHVVFSTGQTIVVEDVNGINDIYRNDHATGETTLVSSSTGGTGGDSASNMASISYDGSVVAFSSLSSDLVTGDTNGVEDVFVKFASGLTVRASTSASGAQANAISRSPAVSGNGLAVAFESDAFNLVPGDLNAQQDVFVKTLAGSIFLASIADDDVTQGSRDSGAPSMNFDGTLVSFGTHAPELHGGTAGARHVVIRDGLEARTVPVGFVHAASSNFQPAPVAGGGLYVGFDSLSDTLVIPDANGTTTDVFLSWWSAPEITSVSPSTITLGASQPVTITGTGFSRYATTDVYTDFFGADGITFSNIVVVDNTTITADVESVIGVTPAGPLNLWVEAAGAGPGVASGALVYCACLSVSP